MSKLKEAMKKQVKKNHPSCKYSEKERILLILVRHYKYGLKRKDKKSGWLTHGEMKNRSKKFADDKILMDSLSALESEGLIEWEETGKSIFYKATQTAIWADA